MDLPVRAEFHFSQDGDSCGGGDYQDLRVSVEDAGGGSYLVLKTDRWALDPEDLESFIKRLRWCVSSCRSIFDEEDKPKDEEKPKGDHPATAITREAFNARIEELKQLKAGWLDGDGVPLSHEGLDWLENCFAQHYSSDLPLPYLFPKPDAVLLMEWKIHPWSISMELDFKTKMADYDILNLDTGRQFSGSFCAVFQGVFGNCVSDLIREHMEKSSEAPQA